MGTQAMHLLRPLFSEVNEMRTHTQVATSQRKQPKAKRRRLGTAHLTAEEFAEGLDALLRSVLLFAEEKEWVEKQRATGFAKDGLASTFTFGMV
jgi:hypothetical protein